MLSSAARKVLNKIVNVASDFSDSETSGDVGEGPSVSPDPMSNLLNKLKLAPPSPLTLEVNPIMEFFDVGKETSSAGPELVWKIHDALRKSDGKECSVFFFDKRIPERLYKMKRKEVVLDRIRACVSLLEKMRHPRMLQIIHTLEEGDHTFAFATEPVMASLHNILAWHDSVQAPPDKPAPLMPWPVSLDSEERADYIPADRSPDAKEYYFLDFELRYGMLQIIEALHFMHYTAHQIHRNLCPHVIIVTKRGTWKLFGLEFVEDIVGSDPIEMRGVTPWSMKLAMLTQPNLDFMAPETQSAGHVSILSDMFSLGLVICAVFNNGKYLIQSQNNKPLYLKQIHYLNQQVDDLLVRIPVALHEAVGRMLCLEPNPRPNTQLLPLIKYFKFEIELAIQAMQYLDEIAMKDRESKSVFFRETLIDALPIIPKKLRWQHIWPAINNEVRSGEVFAALIFPIAWLTEDSTPEEFYKNVIPTLRRVISGHKTIQASVELLGNLHVILKNCNREQANRDILPFLFHTMDSSTCQLQNASLVAAATVSEYINDEMLFGTTLTKVKMILEKNMGDARVIKLTLSFFEKILNRLDRTLVLEQVIPTLLSMSLANPGVVDKVVCLYKSMLAEPRFGLTSNVMATKMLPSLAPQTVNPSLTPEQFTNLMQIMYDMLDNIDKSQRVKFKLENLAMQSEARRLRHQASNENVVVQPFSIPNLRVATQRKTSSAEDMARKNSVGAPPASTGSVGGFKGTGIGQWFFGSNNSTNADRNFLRVASIIPSRRLSDNTMMTPKIHIAPSCASSPGGTSGSASGLPTRRHSSIGPQERRGSAVNLSPPTGYGYRAGSRGGSGSSLSVPVGSQGALARSMMIGGSMPNTSSSVPFLLTSSASSVRSRRPSVALSGSQGSGLLSQISSGVSRHLPGGGGAHAHQPQPRAGTFKRAQAPWQALQGATSAGYNALQNTATAVKKFPSLNITLPR